MGCQCMEKSDKENEVQKEGEENGDQLNNIEIIDKGGLQDDNLNYRADNMGGYWDEKNRKRNEKYQNYPEKMLMEINRIRSDPMSYANEIINAESKIETVNNPDNPDNPKQIYKDKVKVALTKGKAAFEEAADALRLLDPLEPLQMNENLLIPLPENEQDIHNPSYLKEQVKKIRENNQNVDIFFKDLIKRAEVSALLMAVDDGGKNPGRKRNAIMNKDFKYVGINSKFVGDTFVAYFAFSK